MMLFLELFCFRPLSERRAGNIIIYRSPGTAFFRHRAPIGPCTDYSFCSVNKAQAAIVGDNLFVIFARKPRLASSCWLLTLRSTETLKHSNDAGAGAKRNPKRRILRALLLPLTTDHFED